MRMRLDGWMEEWKWEGPLRPIYNSWVHQNIIWLVPFKFHQAVPVARFAQWPLDYYYEKRGDWCGCQFRIQCPGLFIKMAPQKGRGCWKAKCNNRNIISGKSCIYLLTNPPPLPLPSPPPPPLTPASIPHPPTSNLPPLHNLLWPPRWSSQLPTVLLPLSKEMLIKLL